MSEITTINVYALFKNSEPHLARTLYQLDNLISLKDFKWNLFFYSNDNNDKTHELLLEWAKTHPTLLIEAQYEVLGAPSFGSVTSTTRTALLGHFRNKCKKLGLNHPSTYSLVIDSDLEWNNNDFYALFNFIHSNLGVVGALGSSVQNLEDLTFGNTFTSFYDCFCLRDREMNGALYFADSPFLIKEDNEAFREGKPVRVLSAFGGMGIYLSEAYNKCSYSGEASSEHVSISAQLNRFGDLYVIPSCKPIATVDLTRLNMDACRNIGKENLKSYIVANKLREWAGEDEYKFELTQKK
jgi:hypothetical protein